MAARHRRSSARGRQAARQGQSRRDGRPQIRHTWPSCSPSSRTGRMVCDQGFLRDEAVEISSTFTTFVNGICVVREGQRSV